MLKIYNNLKKKIAIFLVIVISVTQNLIYLSPAFAEELAGSHPQEGSFGETQPYSVDEIDAEWADSETTVEADIYNKERFDMIICKYCGREFKSMQAYYAHKLLMNFQIESD